MSWVSKLGWVKTLGLVFGAIAFALAAGQAQSRRKAGQRKEDKAEALLNSRVYGELQKGKKLLDAAHKDKDKAVEAKQRMEAQLEKLGKANEDMDSIADRFNSRRLRAKPASTDT